MCFYGVGGVFGLFLIIFDFFCGSWGIDICGLMEIMDRVEIVRRSGRCVWEVVVRCVFVMICLSLSGYNINYCFYCVGEVRWIIVGRWRL